METTYRVVFADNQGSRASEAFACSVGGSWTNSVPRFDGTNDLAFISVPADQVEYFEEMLDADDNVVSYGER